MTSKYKEFKLCIYIYIYRFILVYSDAKFESMMYCHEFGS